MATQEQLVTLDEVAARLNTMPQKVVNMAGKRVAAWFDGSPAVTLGDAQKLFEAVRAEQAESDREYQRRLADEEQAIKDRVADAQRRAAEREAALGDRRIAGVATSFPGDGPPPEWVQ